MARRFKYSTYKRCPMCEFVAEGNSNESGQEADRLAAIELKLHRKVAH